MVTYVYALTVKHFPDVVVTLRIILCMHDPHTMHIMYYV